MPLTIAHRGVSGEGLAPENTLAAFRLAIDLKADLIELDVHRTKDGRIVVVHDTTLDRTTDRTGAVKELKLADILPADAGDGERVPLLEEALELIRFQAIALVEIKPEDITGDVIQVIKDLEATDYVVIQSFHPRVVAEALALAPEIPRGMLIGQSNVTADRAARVGAGVIVPAYNLIDENVTYDIHRHGLGLWTYTVDEEADMRRLIDAGVDGIITNYPDRLKRVIREA